MALTCPPNLAVLTDTQLSSACSSLRSQVSVALANGATNIIFGATIQYPPSTIDGSTTAVSSSRGYILGSQNVLPGTTFASLLASSTASTRNPFGFGVTSTRASSATTFGPGQLTTYVTSGPNGRATVTSAIGSNIAGGAVTGNSNSGYESTFVTSGPNGLTTVTSSVGVAAASQTGDVSSSSKGGTSKGVIIGAVIGSVLGFLLLVLLVFLLICLLRRKKRRAAPDQSLGYEHGTHSLPSGPVMGMVPTAAGLGSAATLLAPQHAGSDPFADSNGSGYPVASRTSGVSDRPPTLPAIGALDNATQPSQSHHYVGNAALAAGGAAGVGVAAASHSNNHISNSEALSGSPKAFSHGRGYVANDVGVNSAASGRSLPVSQSGLEAPQRATQDEASYDTAFLAAPGSNGAGGYGSSHEQESNDIATSDQLSREPPPPVSGGLSNTKPSTQFQVANDATVTNSQESSPQNHQDGRDAAFTGAGLVSAVPAGQGIDNRNTSAGHSITEEQPRGSILAPVVTDLSGLSPEGFETHKSGSAAQAYYNVPKARDTAATAGTGAESPRNSRILFGRNRTRSDQSARNSGIEDSNAEGRNEDRASRFFSSAFSSGRSSRRQSFTAPTKPIVSEEAPKLPDLDHLGDFDPLFGSIRPRLGAAAPNKQQDTTLNTASEPVSNELGSDSNSFSSLQRPSQAPSEKPISKQHGLKDTAKAALGPRLVSTTTTSGPTYVSTTTTTTNNHRRQDSSVSVGIATVLEANGRAPGAWIDQNDSQDTHKEVAQQTTPSLPLTSNSRRRLSGNAINSEKDTTSNRLSQEGYPSVTSSPTASLNPVSFSGTGSRPITPANQLDNEHLLYAEVNPGTTPPLSSLKFGGPSASRVETEPKGHFRNQSEPLPAGGARHARNFSDMSTNSVLSIPESEPELGTAQSVSVPRKSSKRVSTRYYYPPAHETGGFDFQFDDIRQGPYGKSAKSEPNTAYQTARHSTERLDRSHDDTDVTRNSTQAATRQPLESRSVVKRKPVSSTANRLLEIVNTPRKSKEAFE